VIQPKDRAAVIVFSDQPELKVPLTSHHEVLAGGLAGISAEGETALYDSLVFGLYYLAGLRGKRALILLTDGEDSSSKYSFDDALAFARQSGVAVYSIALGLSSRDTMATTVLRRLAKETGGSFFSANDSGELEEIYNRIEDELRTQYLIAYQSSQGNTEGFREVEIQLGRKNLKVKAIPGYYP
jgi:Ca-activated chloride channel family protein